MAAGAGDGRDVDSAGVYYLSVEEFESRAEPEPDRAPESGETSEGPTGEPADRPDAAGNGREQTRGADRP
jgi:hypothetical protein